MKVTVDKALIEQAIDALTKSAVFCNHSGDDGWQPTAMACHSGIAALRAALAEPAFATPEPEVHGTAVEPEKLGSEWVGALYEAARCCSCTQTATR